jgi:hypothetical protein
MQQPTINLVPGPVSDNISRPGQLAGYVVVPAPREDNGGSDGVPPMRGLKDGVCHGQPCGH